MLTIKSEPYKEYDILKNLKAGDLFRADVGATDEFWVIFMRTDMDSHCLRLDNGRLYSLSPTIKVKPIRNAQLIIE